MEVLNLELVVDDRHVAECAQALQQRLRPGQFRILCQLAAELVARWETVQQGQAILVVPASEREAEVSRALRLTVAGPGLAP